MPVNECERIVAESSTGDFLVRTEGNVHYLCINDRGKTKTYAINESPDGKCTFEGKTFAALGYVLDHLNRAAFVSSVGLPLHLGAAATSQA